jgi:ESCRT-II complex subunit VPS25
MTEPKEPFPFPREYFFPPFFTRQTNLTTHHAQLTKWSALVLSYCRHHRIFKLPLSSSPTVGEDLFHNQKLNRRLSLADAREVIDFLRKDGRAEYVSGGDKEGDVVWIYWRTPEEWASLVEAWVEETGQKGSVLTLYELTEGEGTRGTGESRHAPDGSEWLVADKDWIEFHGMDSELLQKALGLLVKRGKAQIFGQEDSQGVKFF